MLEAIHQIEIYVTDLDETGLEKDQRTVDAVVWNLAVLGEAARHVPESIAERHPAIPWPQIRGIRNRIVHGYDVIDHTIVWQVIREELPPLVAQLHEIMRAESDS